MMRACVNLLCWKRCARWVLRQEPDEFSTAVRKPAADRHRTNRAVALKCYRVLPCTAVTAFTPIVFRIMYILLNWLRIRKQCILVLRDGVDARESERAGLCLFGQLDPACIQKIAGAVHP